MVILLSWMIIGSDTVMIMLMDFLGSVIIHSGSVILSPWIHFFGVTAIETIAGKARNK